MNRIAVFAVVVCIVASPIRTSAVAQSHQIRSLAVATNGRLMLMDFDGNSTVIDESDGMVYRNLIWNSSGEFLAFVRGNRAYHDDLMLMNPDDNQLTVLISDFPSWLPIAFSEDGSSVLYTQLFDQPLSDPFVYLAVMAVNTSTGSQLDMLYTVKFGDGCGDVHLPLFFARTSHGFVYSNHCTGIGASLLDASTGEELDSWHDITRVKVSPDGNHIAGVMSKNDEDRIIVIDLIDLSYETLPVEGDMQVLAWGTSNEIFYGTRFQIDTIDVPEEVLEVSSAFAEFSLPIYDVEIHHIDLANGLDQTLERQQAFALNELVFVPDSQILLYNMIPDIEEWKDNVNAVIRSITFPAFHHNLDSYQFFEARLYALNLKSGVTNLLAEGATDIAVNSVHGTEAGD